MSNTHLTEAELIEGVASDLDISEGQARRFLTAVQKRLFGHLSEKAGNSANFSPLGTFKTKSYKARNGRNPKTGESLRIPAAARLRFSQSETIKRELND